MIGLKLCRWILLGLIALQPLWFGWLAPPELMPSWLAVVLTSGPLLIALPFVWRLRRRALLLAGCVLLFYFCLAIAEAWVTPAARPAAIIQVLLIVLYFTALSSIRFGRRPDSPPAD